MVSNGFQVMVGMHQVSALSYLLFVFVMEALSREFRVVLPWELLYADDLVVIAETADDLIKRLYEWKDFVENRDMRIDMNKTKVMISGEWQKITEKAERGPCSKGLTTVFASVYMDMTADTNHSSTPNLCIAYLITSLRTLSKSFSKSTKRK